MVRGQSLTESLTAETHHVRLVGALERASRSSSQRQAPGRRHFDLGKISLVSGLARITQPLLDVVEVFLAALDDDKELHGWAIMKAVGRSGPTVYGVLDRLEDAGWIVGRWEDQHPESNKPRRRFYRLTPSGTIAARSLLAERRPQVAPHRAAPRLGLAQLAWWFARRTGGAVQ